MNIKNPDDFVKRIQEFRPELRNKSAIAAFFGMPNLSYLYRESSFDAEKVIDKFGLIPAIYILTGRDVERECRERISEAIALVQLDLIKAQAKIEYHEKELSQKILKILKDYHKSTTTKR